MRLRAKQEENLQKKRDPNQLLVAFLLLIAFSLVHIFVNQGNFDKYYQEAGFSLDLSQALNKREGNISTDSIDRQSTNISIDSSSIDDSSGRTKPMLILHVGPMKTGTTAIQLGVLTNKKILKALEEDNVSHSLPYINYRVMGKLLTECLARPINDTHCEAQQRWDDFYQKLVTARFAANNTVQNVLHSVESYAGLPDNKYTIQKLQSLQQVFDVHVIAFYRRPVSWFRSMYKQERKKLMYKSGSGRYLGYTTKDSVDLQTFHENSRDTLDVVDYFGRVFGKDKIHIGSFYAQDLAEEFFCNSFPIPAPTACKFVRDNRKKYFGNSNDFLLFDEDLVVMEAYRQGYLKNVPNKTVISRHEATIKLKTLFDTNGTRASLPKQCLAKTSRVIQFWNRTLSMEQSLSPNPLSSADLLVDFDTDISKLCEVDAKAILEQPEWQRAFSSCVFREQVEGSSPCDFVFKHETVTHILLHNLHSHS